MTTEHTPGPWMANGDGCVRRTIPCGNSTFDQTIKLGSGWVEGCWTDTDADEETLANAKLVSAAPDMLAALKEICDWASKDGDAIDLNRGLDMAHAAIAKATKA